MNRRDFLLAASVAAGGTAASGAAAAQQANASGGNQTGGGNATGGNQSAGGNQSSANATGGNATGGNTTGNASGGNQSASGGGGGTTKTVKVGAGSGTAFAPKEATIAPGSTIVWKWTGEGGAHNVVADDGAFDSGSPVEGSDITFKHTFQKTGEFPYHCEPHEAVGMVGTIVVQEGGASSGGGGGGESEPSPEEMGVPFQAHFVGIATILMMVVSLIYTFFTVKYGESPNAKGGNN